MLPGQVPAYRQRLLHPVQCFEQSSHRHIVARRRLGEPGPVHAIVHVAVNHGVPDVDLGPQRLRVEVQRVAREVVKGVVQDADEVGGLVVDDAALPLVPQHGHRNLPRVGRVRRRIEPVMVAETPDTLAAVLLLRVIQPSSPITGPASETPTISSRPLSLRKMSVRKAQGHRYET
jgi:hypothetical protein